MSLFDDDIDIENDIDEDGFDSDDEEYNGEYYEEEDEEREEKEEIINSCEEDCRMDLYSTAEEAVESNTVYKNSIKKSLKHVQFSDSVGGSGSSSKKPPAIIYITEPENRKTRPIMTKYEYARLIGSRAQEIENSGGIDISVNAKQEGLTNSLDIAEFELNDLSSPFPLYIYREIAKNVFEVWNARELKLQYQLLCEAYDAESSEIIRNENKEVCPWKTNISNTFIFKKLAILSHKT